MKRTILSLDVASTKILAVMAEVHEDNSISIIGKGIKKSQGVKKGVITNLELASKTIREAVNEAKMVAGTDYSQSTISVSGAQTMSLDTNGVVNIPNKEIGIKEIKRAMDNAIYNAKIEANHEIMHVLPYNFKVDEQSTIEDPLGMNASRLEVFTHIITVHKYQLNNLNKALKMAGIRNFSLVFNGYASALANINSDEKDLGVILIDIGGNTSEIVVYTGNSIRYNDFLGVGSNHITNDLSMALHTPINIAEDIKIKYADLNNSSVEDIKIPTIGDDKHELSNMVSTDVIQNVVYARVEETLSILAQSFRNSGLLPLVGSGLIVTGGLAKLRGIKELASAIFGNIPTRIGLPKEFKELSGTNYSVINGLLKYSVRGFSPYEIDANKIMRCQYKSINNMSKNFEINENYVNGEYNNDDAHDGSENRKESSQNIRFTKWINELF